MGKRQVSSWSDKEEECLDLLTVFFIPKGQKKPLLFKGNRTVAGLAEFANEHGSVPFQIDSSVDLRSLADELAKAELEL